MVTADSVEAIITEIGFGRWQVYIVFVCMIAYTVGPVQQLGSTLLSAHVPFRCSYPEAIQLENLTGLISTSKESYGTLVNSNETDFPSRCLGLPRITHELKSPTGMPSCPEINYDTSVFQSTVITEWNLVCENANLRPLFQMMFSVGSLLCSTFGGQLSDWLGRKKTFQIGSILTMASVIATSIVPWYSVMLATRILSGVGTILMVFSTYTLLSEISPINLRVVTALFPGIIYFAWLPVIAGVAYLVPHWRRLLLLCNSPLLLLIPLTFTIDESPRWLLQRGRRDEAVVILKKAARKNGVTLSSSTTSLLDEFRMTSDEDIEQQREYEREQAKSQGSVKMIKACYSSQGMRTIMVISPLMMLLMRSLHVGVVLNANNFTSTNPFEYVAISGTMGVVAIIISIPISQRLGRKIIIGGAQLVGGALMLFDIPVPLDYWWLKLSLVMVSFAIVCAAFQVTFAFRAELFPTVIRTRGFTFTNLAGALGEMSIPLVTEIAVMHKWWAASVTFGLLGIVGSVLLPFLPETKDRPMPETLQDVEDRYWDQSKGLPSKGRRVAEDNNEETSTLQ